MTKKELRKIYREKRNALTTAERSRLDDLLLIQLQTVNLPFINTLFSYWPIEAHHEPDTHLFTDYIEFRNPELIITYSKSNFLTNEMTAILVNEGTEFIKNNNGIYEPSDGSTVNVEEIDIVLVPLLAVDKKGYRVGYGKGFYDKFLVGCRKECIKIGFSYFEPIEEISDTDEFDVPLNLCITPQNVYVF